ncbi:hypothetical protein ACFSUK_09665 [Sphingobium scionense]
MADWVKAASALGIGLSLASLSIEPAFSPATLAALDPVRLARSLCSGPRVGSALARELLIAAPLPSRSPTPHRSRCSTTSPGPPSR